MLANRGPTELAAAIDNSLLGYFKLFLPEGDIIKVWFAADAVSVLQDEFLCLRRRLHGAWRLLGA